MTLHTELGTIEYVPFHDTPENRRLLAEQQRACRWPTEAEAEEMRRKAPPYDFN